MKEKEFQKIILNDKYINGECKRINNTSLSYIDYNDFKKYVNNNIGKELEKSERQRRIKKHEYYCSSR